MKRQKAVWMLVSGLVLTVMSVLGARADELTPHPPKLTIQGAGTKPTITHVTQFKATLTAVVEDPPKSTTEATVTGPTYKWSGGKGSVQFVSTTDNPAILDSGTPPVYPATQDTPLFTIPVSCTATYISTDIKTGKETPIEVSNDSDVNVEFLVRWPKSVKQLGYHSRVDKDYGRSPFKGVIAAVDPNRALWGHSRIYDLRVIDNQADPQPYAEGVVQESFGNVYSEDGSPPNGKTGGATWPGSDFPDVQSYYLRHDGNIAAPVGSAAWYAEERRIAARPFDKVFQEFDQIWIYLEPPGAPVALGSHHITKYQFYTRRTGG